MKNLTGLILLLMTICVFSACRKNDNPKLPDGIKNSVLPQLLPPADYTGNFNNINTFSNVINVGLYFPNGEKPTKMDLYVTYLDDYSKPKLLKADITTYPTPVTVTGKMLLDAFGLTAADLAPGDFFGMTVDMTFRDGTVKKGFQVGVDANGNPINIEPYGGDAYGFPDSYPMLYYTYKP